MNIMTNISLVPRLLRSGEPGNEARLISQHKVYITTQVSYHSTKLLEKETECFRAYSAIHRRLAISKEGLDLIKEGASALLPLNQRKLYTKALPMW